MAQTRVLVTGGAGFIGHHLTNTLKRRGQWVRSVDIRPVEFGEVHADEFALLDMRRPEDAMRAAHGVDHVYALAADMGGMGYISQQDARILHDNSLIDLNTVEAARANGASRLLYGSSACVYPEYRQEDANVTPLAEEHAYPAAPQDAYGWEKRREINAGRSPIVEPGLADLVAAHAGSTFHATTNMAEAIGETDLTFIIVPTPSDETGGFSNAFLRDALEQIANALKGSRKPDHLVAISSTVMPGSIDRELGPLLAARSGRALGVGVDICYESGDWLGNRDSNWQVAGRRRRAPEMQVKSGFVTSGRPVATNNVGRTGEIVDSRERLRSGDQLNQVRAWFTVHRRARILGLERALASRRGRTDQVPPTFCGQTRRSQALVPRLWRPRRNEPALVSSREH